MDLNQIGPFATSSAQGIPIYQSGTQVGVWSPSVVYVGPFGSGTWKTFDLSGNEVSSGTMTATDFTVGDPVNGILVFEFYTASITQLSPFHGTATLHVRFIGSPIIGDSGNGSGYMSYRASTFTGTKSGRVSVRQNFTGITISRLVPVMFLGQD